MEYRHKWYEVTIDTSASGGPSDAIVLDEGMIPVGVMMPAAWTAGGLSFQGSHDGGTFYDLYDDQGNEVTVSVAAQQFVAFDAEDVNLRAPVQLKIRSGTSGTPVQQGSERTLYLVCRSNV